MSQNGTTKVKLKLGSLRLEYEGREEFLKSEVLAFVRELGNLQAIGDRDAVSRIEGELASLSEMGEMESLRLQMAMDRVSKLMSTLANVLKKISDTVNAMVSNLR